MEKVPAATDSDRGAGPARHPLDRFRHLWASNPTGISIELLRVGIGLVWLLNLVFVLDPANQFFPTFRDTALSFAPTTLGGPGFANFVADHATFFAWVTALLTAYLALAFVAGFTTRLACVVGIIASAAFLFTQYLSTFQSPGGTDVGPHPLYLLVYLILLVGGGGRFLSVDAWIWARRKLRFPQLFRLLAGPRA